MSIRFIRNAFVRLAAAAALCGLGFSIHAGAQDTVKKIEAAGPKQVSSELVRVAGQPQIQIQRTPLESPQGMKFYKIQRLPVKQPLVEQYRKSLSLMAKPAAAPHMQILAEKSGASRLQVNSATGYMVLVPNWTEVAAAKPQLLNKEQAFAAAQQFIAKNELLTKDVSMTALQHLVTLSRTDVTPGKQITTSDVGQTVVFQRQIARKPVVGPGSVVTVDLGHQGQVVGFNRSWNALSEAAIQPKFKNNQEVYGEIEQQVKGRLHGAVTAKVNQVRLINYGQDKQYVQPAYFYTIEIDDPAIKGKSFMHGVVAAAKNSPEAIVLARPTTGAPTEAKKAALLPGPLKATGGDPSVGRYVVRDDSHDWVDDANEFKQGLVDGHPGNFPAITFGDYYWDQPRMWTSSEDSFVDRWNVTLMEGHGNTWLFTTSQNCCDIVNLNASNQPAYGDRKGGDTMRFLILKGCAIIPGPPDRSDWATPWWRIFKGLRQAVGFRTEMYIDDDISYGFAKNIASNYRVLDSWFAATNGSFSYQWERFWGASVPGYGTVVMIPGHEGDGIYSTGAAPAATSTGLTIWYQH